MTLKAIFHKPVDRSIEGVIKADDEACLRQEIEEYVLTNEVEKRLELFLDAYNNYEGANGVWVSGFFGSGKSHLLKMLALVLENRKVDGQSALEMFLPKCGDNEILRGDLKRAVDVPSKSILFNIDLKSDVISKTQIDALLAVFVKVFDDMCGYYGKQGHIAQFERDLDSRGLYEQFKAAYEQSAGYNWSKGREQAILEDAHIAAAYAQVTGEDSSAGRGILEKYRNQYRVSIEDFADQVQAFIEQQEPQFRLNFFVDEVGQYIANNVKLMTNLQTIAESLAIKSRGRAWIVVTAQEDMDSVLGEMGKQQSNDFTKIQDRFSNRMKLTSANVDEVIQKRLLHKNDTGVRLLSDLYHRESNNFKTLFDFTDGSQSYRNFRDRDHFIHSYPFAPYQFSLFQAAIQNLSYHSAFEGKHSSVGERSMLGVFQQVAILIAGKEVGELATFDLMFEGIRTTLKSSIQRAVIQAEAQLDDRFAIKVLKALFLVKYVKEFKATIRNICVLLIGHFDQDMGALRKEIGSSLNLLEQQTYIQRTGDLYEYLTDEEKDVEQEIKNTDIENSEISEELEKLVFDYVIKQRKIRYEDNGQDYAFTRKLDGIVLGRTQELAVHVISPFYENSGNEDLLLMHSMGVDELLVILPADERLVRDLMMYKRTEKYIKHNISQAQQDSVKRILTEKSFKNRQGYSDLKERVQNLIGSAKMFVNANEIETSSSDGQMRVAKGFQELIARTYSNLPMLRGVTYTENDIASCLTTSQRELFSEESLGLSESEQEVLAYIQGNTRNGIRTTLKQVLEKFEKKPYGWYYAAILCTLAKLYAGGKIELRIDGNILEDGDIERALRNSHTQGNVVLDPQVEFTASQVRHLKEFYEDFFDAPAKESEAKALGKDTASAFKELDSKLTVLSALHQRYPFLDGLKPILERLGEYSRKPYTWYLVDLYREEDYLLDAKEQIIDPIRRFMGTDEKPGEMKKIYDAAKKFVDDQEPNFNDLESEQPEKLRELLASTTCYKGDCIQQIKVLKDELQTACSAVVKSEITMARQKIDELEKRLSQMEEFLILEDGEQESLIEPFSLAKDEIGRQKLIAVIRDRVRRFEEKEYQNLLRQTAELAERKKTHQEPGRQESIIPGVQTEEKKVAAAEPRIEYIIKQAVKIPFAKAWLSDEADVEQYVSAMKSALLDEIRKGKRIQI